MSCLLNAQHTGHSVHTRAPPCTPSTSPGALRLGLYHEGDETKPRDQTQLEQQPPQLCDSKLQEAGMQQQMRLGER